MPSLHGKKCAQVYACDVVMSTGEGKPRVLDEKQTQVYKRALDKT